MFTPAEWFAILAIVIGMVSYGHYMFSIIWGKTRPHAFSWIIWCVASSVVFFAQNSDNAGVGAWVTVASALACGTIALMSLWRGERNITRSDWVMFLAAMGSIPLWYVTSDPMWSVILLASIDFMGIVPSIRKSWNNPHSETLVYYVLTVLKYVIAMIIMENVTVTTMLDPAVSVLEAGLFTVITICRRQIVKQAVVIPTAQ